MTNALWLRALTTFLFKHFSQWSVFRVAILIFKAFLKFDFFLYEWFEHKMYNLKDRYTMSNTNT